MSSAGQIVSQRVLRFFSVALVGLVIDVAIGSALIVVFQMPDIPAAALGLFSGMVSNYFMHLHWTFASVGRRASARHFLVFVAGVLVTLAVRSAVLWGIQASGWQDALAAPVRLGIGAAVAFFLSYLISSRVVFRAQDADGTPDDGGQSR